LFARTILSSCTPLLPWAFTLFLSATITTFRSRWAIFVKLGHLLLPSFAHDKCSRHGNTHRSTCLSYGLCHRWQVGGRHARIWWKTVDLRRIQPEEDGAGSADAIFIIGTV